jgi:hypothetical protein
MVRFLIGYNRYDADGKDNPLVEKLVSTLNEIFGDKKCPIHPDEKWSINVDLMKNGNLQFSSMKQNGCSYPLTLEEEDIFPFLERYGIFPLPFH